MRSFPLRSLGATALVACSMASALPAQKPVAPARQAGAPVAAAATKVTTVEGITEYRLPNGLRVLLFPDQSKPTATINITYLVGSASEGAGETGMAHLLEHMVFKGSTHHRNIPQELTDHGARPNGTTWLDRTNYFETVPATDANIDWALDLESDRMVNSFIAQKDWESEYSVVRNELEAGENSPFGVLMERTMRAAYTWHGYGRSTVGTRSDLEHVPIARLQAFYHRYYQPDNSVLVVAGKFDPARTLGVIEKKFGAIPKPVRTMEKGNQLFPNYTVEPTQDGERFVAVRRVGDAPIVMMGYHVPAGSHPDFAAIDVLDRILSNEPSGRLYKALVDTKLAASTGSFAFQLHDPGMELAFAQLRANGSIDSVRDAMAKTLDDAAKLPITDEEVARAKTAFTRDFDLQIANSEQVGFALTEWAAMGDWRLMFLHRDRVAKVTTADVQRVAAAYLKPSNRTVAIFYPTAQPDRAEIPPNESVDRMVAGYTGKATVVQAGEAFDASPKNIDARTAHATLTSGMHVSVLSKTTRGGSVNGVIVLRFGSEATLGGKAKIADMMVDMLSRGTVSLTREQVKDSLDKLKARAQIFGQVNTLNVMFETTRENFAPVLALIASELESPRFDAAELEKLRQENLSQIEQLRSEPTYLASIEMQRRTSPFPKGHPMYAPTLDEAAADYQAVTLDQVKQFHASMLGASSGDLSVVGDVDANAVKAEAEQLFGGWKSPEPFVRIANPGKVSDSATVVIETPDKANAMLLSHETIMVRDDDPDYPALALANFMMGGGFLNSRLAVRLRQQEGISYGVGSQFAVSPFDRGAGAFVTYAILNPQNIDRATTALLDELQKARTAGFTQKELDAAKPGYLQQRMQSRANDNELVGILAQRRYADRTLAWDEAFEAKVNALTVEQVNAAVKKYLDPSKTLFVRAGDFRNHPPTKPTP